ncbi:hypothetical protein ACFY2M_35890 [Streptomyces sp. NPDC001276]|uniref:hypothetical protein n=1 Tax=Streptomyces sp. NPDC001276 TaxID=3364555 RepID=UPI003688FCC7
MIDLPQFLRSGVAVTGPGVDGSGGRARGVEAHIEGEDREGHVPFIGAEFVVE